jgi:phenol 2-monooxygenase
LVRFGINVIVIDDRSKNSTTGRADGLQPRTIEILRHMRIADRLLLKGVKTHDMRFWHTSLNSPLRRLKRDVQFPCDQVDTIDPYILNAHQTFVEEVLLKDMMERGESVTKHQTFVDYQDTAGDPLLRIICESSDTHEKTVFKAKYLVGCDGTHSNVAKSMGARQIGLNSGEVWGVIDGVIETNFPDIYSKTIIFSQESGTVVIFPRARNMTRIYVELKPDSGELTSSRVDLTEDYSKDKIAEILEPYSISWKSIG